MNVMARSSNGQDGRLSTFKRRVRFPLGLPFNASLVKGESRALSRVRSVAHYSELAPLSYAVVSYNGITKIL